MNTNQYNINVERTKGKNTVEIEKYNRVRLTKKKALQKFKLRDTIHDTNEKTIAILVAPYVASMFHTSVWRCALSLGSHICTTRRRYAA